MLKLTFMFRFMFPWLMFVAGRYSLNVLLSTAGMPVVMRLGSVPRCTCVSLE